MRLLQLCLATILPPTVGTTTRRCPARFPDAGAGAGAECYVRADQCDGGAAGDGAAAKRRGPGRGSAWLGSTLSGERAQGAVGNSAVGVPAHSAAEPGTFAKKYFAARPEHLPVLRADFSQFGTEAGPCGSAFEGRAEFLGESGSVLLSLQQQQGRPNPRGSRL